jgi:hypothetical protein
MPVVKGKPEDHPLRGKALIIFGEKRPKPPGSPPSERAAPSDPADPRREGGDDPTSPP